MKINFNKKSNESLKSDEIYLEIQYCSKNKEVQQLIEYINNYNKKQKNMVIVLNEDYSLIEIDINDIIMFYSDK